MTREPIFIGGLSYSGKTYLRLMLQAHPHLVVTRRSKMWTRYFGRFGDLAQGDNLERCMVAMLRSRHIQALQPDPERIRREFQLGAPTYGRLFALFHAHHAERAGKPRWGDQLGRVEAYADPIFAAYPAARMIHMVRDPLTRTALTVASTRYRRAKLGWEVATWRRSVALALRNSRHYPDRYRIVRYEDLLRRPEHTLRHICAFLEEPYAPVMIHVENVPGLPHGIPDDGVPVPLSMREVALVQLGTGRQRRDLAYGRRPVALSVEDRLLLPVLDWPLSLAGQALWWMRERGAYRPVAPHGVH